MHYISRILAAIALVVIFIFAVQNLEAVDVAFLGWSVTVSKVVVILAAYVLGMVSGWGLVELVKRSMQS